MLSMTTSRPAGTLPLVIAAVLWGTIGVATQAIYGLETTSSLYINMIRTVVAALVLLLACWRAGTRLFAAQRRDLLVMFVSGALLALSHAAYFAAIRAAGVTISTLLTICVAPLAVHALSVLFGFERISGRTMLALACALLGSILLVTAPGQTQMGDDVATGALYALAAAVCYGSAIVCGRFLAAHYDTLHITALSFCAGSLVLVLLNFVSTAAPIQSAQGWALAIYLGLVPTALAYSLFQRGLRTVPATTASIIGMIDPVVAAVLAWALYGESLTWVGIFGSALLLASIAFLARE